MLKISIKLLLVCWFMASAASQYRSSETVVFEDYSDLRETNSLGLNEIALNAGDSVTQTFNSHTYVTRELGYSSLIAWQFSAIITPITIQFRLIMTTNFDLVPVRLRSIHPNTQCVNSPTNVICTSNMPVFNLNCDQFHFFMGPYGTDIDFAAKCATTSIEHFRVEFDGPVQYWIGGGYRSVTVEKNFRCNSNSYVDLSTHTSDIDYLDTYDFGVTDCPNRDITLQCDAWGSCRYLSTN